MLAHTHTQHFTNTAFHWGLKLGMGLDPVDADTVVHGKGIT